MKKAILQLLILNILFLLGLSWVAYFSVYPRIVLVEEKKEELLQLNQEIQETSQSGISFAEFKKQATADSSLDKYNSFILGDFTQNFYETSSHNSDKTKSFSAFAEEKRQEVESIMNSEEYQNRQTAFESVLPVFSQGNYEGMTRLEFVSYLEQLFYAFNLDYDWELGFEQLQRYETTEDEPHANNSPDDLIYYIPMSFSVTGQKKDVFDLIHFFENVWKVEFKDGSLTVFTDDVIKKYIPFKRKQGNTNIYNSQLAEIESISFSEYPDSASFSSNSDLSLLDLVYSSQAYEKYTVNLEINFFLAWVPEFNMKQAIDDFITSYTNLNKEVPQSYAKFSAQKQLYTSGEQIQALEGLKKMSLFFTAMKDDYNEFLKSYKRSEDIVASYNLSRDYAAQLDLLEAKYKEFILILDN